MGGIVNMSGRFLIWIFLVLCFIPVFLGGCDRTKEPVKIGLSVNLSGVGGDAGEHIRDGALLAVDDINHQGGIDGRPLQLLVRDDKNSDEGIKEADESLIKEKVVAIIGHSFSNNTLKAYPIVTSQGTLLITAYTATTQLAGKDDLFLRTAVDCALYGKKTATLLQSNNVQKISVLMDMSNAEYVEDYLANLQKFFQGTVGEVRFNSRQQVEWERIMTELLSTEPEAVLLLTEANFTGIAVQRLRDIGYAGRRVATVWAQTPELLKVAADAAEGLSIVTFIDPENKRPDYLRFDAQLQEKFKKKASARSARAYEMVSIIADGLRRAKEMTSLELKNALLAGRYNTLMGELAFDQFGDVIRPVYEVRVANEKFVNSGEIN